MNPIDRFWLSPAPAARLATLRVACGAFATIYLLVRAPVLLDWRGVTAAQWEPVGVMQLLAGPLPGPLVVALWAACVACGAAFTLGLRYKLTGPAFGLLFLWVTSYRNSWGMIFHNDNMPVLHALALGLCPAAGEALSIDARARPTPADHARFGWPIKLLCAVTAATYVIAGVAKLRGAGLHWADGDVLRHYVAYDAVRKQQLGSIHSPVGAWLAGFEWPFAPFSALTLLLELGAPLALVGPRIAAVWAFGIWGFHVSVLLLMAIAFPYPLTVGLLSFLPAERLWRLRPLRRVERWLARAVVVGCALGMLAACSSEPAPRPSPTAVAPAPAAKLAPAAPPPLAPEAPMPSAATALGIDGRSMPSPTTVDGVLSFEAILGERVLRDRLRVDPGDTDPTVLVVRDEARTFTGLLALVDSGPAAIDGELDAHYLEYAKNFYQLVTSDRATGGYGASYHVVTDEPRIVSIGRLRGVLYAFSEQQGSTVVQRTVSAAFVQGTGFYVMVASAPASPDADSSFARLEDLAKFERHFPALLASLRLPAP